MIQVDLASPPHRDDAVAELRIHNFEGRGVIAIPAEVFRSDGIFKIAIFQPEGGVAWEFELADLLAAIARGTELIDSIGGAENDGSKQQDP
jgi:hypothetical protein